MVFMRLFKSWKDGRNARLAKDVASQARHTRLAEREERAARGREDLAETLALLTSLDPRSLIPPGATDALAELTEECAHILRAMRETYADRKEDPLRGLALESGWMSSESKGAKTPYVFLRVPGRPGFLLEPDEEGNTTRSRAVEARPLLHNDATGEAERPSLFSRRQAPLTTFVRLEPGLWRLFEEGKQPETLALTRLAERLLAQAVQEMVSVSKNQTNRTSV